MKKIKDISIGDYKPISSLMINRHYYFDIKIIYENDSKVINKRYSEIEQINKVLLQKYPGCRIPKFPTKTLLMNIHISEEEKKEIIKKIEKFLRHIINHKILSEEKAVKDFFANNEINEKPISKFDDDINNSDFNVNEDLDKSENNKNEEEIENEMINDFEQIDFKDTPDYKKWLLNDLLNMFLEENNEKKGLINKTKGIIASTYYYFISNHSQENQNNNINESSIFDSHLQEDNLKYVKKISNELGEDKYINEYGIEIMKVNDGLSYLIKNFINIQNCNIKKLKSLRKIKKVCIDDINKNNEKDNEKDKNKKIDRHTKWDRKIFEGEVNNKLEEYISINSEFYEKDLKDKLDEINETKTVLEELKEIFERKESHINFLKKLNAKFTDIQKRKELEPENKSVLNDYNLMKNYLEAEIDFIKTLNKHLKYEIENYKNNIENNVYKYINELYINKYNKQTQILNKLQKAISFESDSENSSKEDNSENNSQLDKNINNKKNNEENKSKISQRKDSLSSDDF